MFESCLPKTLKMVELRPDSCEAHNVASNYRFSGLFYYLGLAEHNEEAQDEWNNMTGAPDGPIYKKTFQAQ